VITLIGVVTSFGSSARPAAGILALVVDRACLGRIPAAGARLGPDPELGSSSSAGLLPEALIESHGSYPRWDALGEQRIWRGGFARVGHSQGQKRCPEEHGGSVIPQGTTWPRVDAGLCRHYTCQPRLWDGLELTVCPVGLRGERE
jgi:hypothetical protein